MKKLISGIRLITPAAQGGTTDLLARVFGQKLGEAWGHRLRKGSGTFFREKGS